MDIARRSNRARPSERIVYDAQSSDRKVAAMTRDEALAKVKMLVEDSCAHNEAKLVIDMALQGIPADRILDAYLGAIEWNEQATIDGLKEAERIIDAMLSDGAASLKG
jgi:hypothetical protein